MLDPYQTVRKIGSSDPKATAKAQEAFSKFMGPTISKILGNTTASNIYSGLSPMNGLNSSSFPMDLIYEEEEVDYKKIVSDWRKTL